MISDTRNTFHFQINDIIRLVDFQSLKSYRSFKRSNVNLFKIKGFENNLVLLYYLDKKVGIDQIAPVRINGSEDVAIYYDPIMAGSVLEPGQSKPIHKTNYQYYWDRLTNREDDLSKEIMKMDFHYVHELQHYLQEVCDDDFLKIKY